uniref:HAD-IA family hydrolase n=1 Tax=Altererythrobacter segetis TaxID=1104773 RepID=UPI00140BE11F|nr:HAD-IA family hydrolase [Altererythrobacter segetis]
MPARLAVFDCDGTISDGQAAVCAAMAGAFAAVALPVPPDYEIRRIVGLSLPVAVRHLAPGETPAMHGEIVDAYRAAFFKAREQGLVAEPLYEGIAELLRSLHGKGWLLGVATGKSDRGLNGCLVNHGIFDLFVTLQTADRHPSKPDPAMLAAAMLEAGAEPGETVMIGDTSFDIAMARAAGCRAIGVAWGYHAPDELLEAGAEAVAFTAAELEDLIDG